MEEEIKNVLEHNERLIKILEELQSKVAYLEERMQTLEGLDIAKYMKNKEEQDEVIDERIANLLEIANKLRTLNTYKRDAIIDYLAKKSGIGKTKLEKVIKTFEMYLENLL